MVLISKKKSLGQNFLKPGKIIEDIVSVSEIEKDENILEIGPGEGALTEELLKKGARVLAIEKDLRLMSVLEEKFNEQIKSGWLILINDDILNLSMSKISFNITYGVGQKYKIVANIPYNITGQIIRKFLEEENKPTQMTLLVQKEVAERITTKDGKESLLSLSVKAYGEPKYMRTVPRGAFTPIPNVDSAVLKVSNISNKKFEAVSENEFFKTLHSGFAHKRKKLLSNLQSLYNKEKLSKAYEDLGINENVRAEELNLESWLGLIKNLNNN